MTELFRAKGIGKSFVPGLPVLQSVDLDLRAGEVHSLVGENGAGKSTLSGIISGIQKPSEGSMTLSGKEYAPTSRRQAEKLGVSIVTQELNLFPTLTVAESLTFEHMPSKLGVINRRRQNELAEKALLELGVRDLEVTRLISTLGIAHRQLVEVAKGLQQDCKILILDEPTAALSPSEAELLFQRIQILKERGVAIVYISHRFEEVLSLSDRITVLRDGCLVARHDRGSVDRDGLVTSMVGRKVTEAIHQESSAREDVALEARDVRGATFKLHKGEIVGLAGLVGAGRTELLRAIFGADKSGGEVILSGKQLQNRTPTASVKAGMGMLTEDRKDQGLLLPQPVRVNASLVCLRTLAKFGIVKRDDEEAVAEDAKTNLAIKARSIEQPVGELSGGNQQKVVLAKWLARNCDVLLFDEPTRGIDIGAKSEIYSLMTNLAKEGKGILVASSELNELLALCDRIIVLSNGEVAGEFARADFNADAIMKAALSKLKVSA